MLFSTKNLMGLEVFAGTDHLGQIDDILISDADGHPARYVVGMRNFMPGKAVIIEGGLLQHIDLASGHMVFNLTRDSVRDAPPYRRGVAIGDTFPKYMPNQKTGAAESPSREGCAEDDYGHIKALQEEGPDGQAGFPESFEPFYTVETPDLGTIGDPAEKKSPIRNPHLKKLNVLTAKGTDVVPLESERSERPAH